MANAREIAELLTQGIRGPQGPEDAAFHTGTILTWDRVTGANTVNIQGTVVSNVRSIHSTAVGGSWFQAGDTVLLIRKQTQWFILGRVTTTNSAASGFQSNTLTVDITQNTGNTWQDLTGNPNSPSVSAYTTEKGAIIIWTCQIGIDVQQSAFPGIANPSIEGAVSFDVTGASTIPAGSFSHQQIIHRLGFDDNTMVNFGINNLHTVTGILAIGGSAGLLPGLNNFRLKYRSENGAARFRWPGINVIPL